MLTEIHPKLPMRDKTATRSFYKNLLNFQEVGNADFDGYLMMKKDNIQIHFFEFKTLSPKKTTDKFISELMILTTFINHF